MHSVTYPPSTQHRQLMKQGRRLDSSRSILLAVAPAREDYQMHAAHHMLDDKPPSAKKLIEQTARVLVQKISEIGVQWPPEVSLM